MSLPVAPQAVTIYDVVKDLGFPIAVTLILLFQIGPKLDSLTAAQTTAETQITTLAEVCAAQAHG